MVKVDIYNTEGRPSGDVEVDETRLGREVNVPVLREMVRAYEASRRVGTKNVRSRGEIAGSGRKLYRQKHTGNARAGSRKTNIRRGGGKAHAPGARDYRLGSLRKVRRLATRSALLARLRDGEALIVESIALDAPSTRAVAGMLRSMGVGRSCLIVVAGEPDAVRVMCKSARNIAGVTVRRVQDVNAYDLLQPQNVVFTKAAFDAFMESYGS